MDPKQFFEFLCEFRKLRGDYGLRKNQALEEKLYPNIIKLSKELNSRQKANEDKPSKTSEEKREIKLSPGKKLDK